ncbi:hypothetical protein ABW20_dc0107407 [Dactylellina cionopaga]|nr:hypothetical protein ABW20_dc0107407 [Dactylellina cionopaga]
MSDEREGDIGLPKPPPKAKKWLPHLAFRVPGNKISEEREQALESELKEQEVKLQGLKQEQEKRWEQCQKELSVIRREPPRGQSQYPGRISRIYSRAQQHLEDMAQGLELAISQKIDEDIIESKRFRDFLERVEAALESQNLDLELDSLREKELNNKIDDMTKTISGLKEANVLLGRGNPESVTEGAERVTNQENGYQKPPQEGQWQEKNQKSEEQEEKEKEEETQEEETQKEETQKEEEKQKHLEEEGENMEQSKLQRLRLQEQQQQLEEQKIQENKQKIMQYRAELQDLKMEKVTLKRDLDKGNQKKKELEKKKFNLEKKLENLKKHANEIQPRAEQERERENERKAELERQQGRDQTSKELRDEMGILSLRSRRWGNDLDLEAQGQLQEIEEILKKAGDLEAMFTEVLRLKQKLEQAQDLKSTLSRDKYLEEKLRQPSKQDSSPHQIKDHLSGSPLEYKALEKSQIRLLILWPAPSNCYPIICTLKTESLEKDPKLNQKYAALSYFWGTDPPEALIYLLDGEDRHVRLNKDNWGSTAQHAKRIPIRNNLFRALLRLRREDAPVALWVDFLCIDQVNTVEKTEQLRKMVNIYRMAENVCVWLGEADNQGRSDTAMEFIRTIMDFAMLDTYVEDKEQAQKWYALSELMRDRWFSRRWVVQEIALARSATVHCGSKSVQWPEFVDAVSILVSNQARIKSLFDLKVWREGPETLGEVQSFGANILIEATSSLFLRAENGDIVQPVRSIEALVTSLKTFDTSDQRDIIYSLVSIARDTYSLSESYQTRRKDDVEGREVNLEIDYKKSEVDVYKDFTEFCIKSSNSLDIICRPWAMPLKNKGTDGESTLPSWIPLLSDSEFGEPEQVYRGRKNGENLVGPVNRQLYRASGDSKADAQFIRVRENGINGQTRTHSNVQNGANGPFTDPSQIPLWSLRVKGFMLTKIEKVSLKNTAGLVLRESLEMGGWSGIEHTTESVPDKVWRTLVADRDSEGQIPPTWYQRACLRCLEIADTFNGGDLNVGQLLQGDSGMLRAYLTRKVLQGKSRKETK